MMDRLERDNSCCVRGEVSNWLYESLSLLRLIFIYILSPIRVVGLLKLVSYLILYDRCRLHNRTVPLCGRSLIDLYYIY